MNCEEQAVDLCNAIDLCNVSDNTISHTSDEILPRDDLLPTDGDLGERDTAVLTRLKDVHSKDDGSSELKAPHSKNNGSIAVSADPVNGSAGDLQQNISKFEEPPVSKCSVGDGGDDDGEMDIGVDLSLDENGVLEFEPTAQTQSEESASSCENSLTSETVIELHSQQPPEERSEDVPSETTSAATTPGNGAGSKHGAKRVTFPSDEDIVSGAVEPKDPWRHAQNVTVEEILNAYRQACQKLNCKPIPKVFKQIQDLKDLTQRNECLELKGEKLDYKSCESLEEIFKRVQFKVLDLEQTNLDEDVTTALKMNMNLRELYLAENKLNGLQDSAQLGNLLKFNYNIQILDLRNNHILDSGLAYVCEGLKEQRKGLVTLVLWNNQLTHNGMGYLAAALPFTQSLETLNLGHNAVGNEGVHKLKDGLIANRSILRLGLASTKLSCEGAVAIAEFIAESPRILRLDMRENEIKTGGLMALTLAFKVNSSLLRLDLDREPKKETVKSFIETQRALLADIQNGCKRNFILAKEKEETEQKMRQSVSMAEIATEDQTQEDEDASAEKIEEENTAGQGDATNEGSASDSQEVIDQKPTLQDDSDSDTEDEDAAEEPKASANTTHPIPIPAISACKAVASTPPLPESPAGITVTEASAVPGAPASPSRCFSVSSPGRGHKIFMVTRVESPPEQQQMTAFSERAAESQTSTQTNIKAPLDAPLNQTASELSTLTSRAETTPAPVQPLNASSLADKQENVKESQASPSEIAQEPATPSESQKDAVLADQTHLEQQLIVNTSIETSQNVREKGQTFCSHTEQKQESSPTQTEPSVSGQSRDETLCPEQLREVQPGANGEKQVQSSEQQQASQLQEVTRGHEPLDEEDCSAPDQISTEEAEGHPAVSTAAALPNGLKPEFAFHLLEPEGPKPASCIMEHVSVTAELSCGQDLEELLLDASLDTSRDAP
ncbi:protein phosphatase 1 regulatory subunit 37-like [Sinocyclocheilus rhinocerous]|uniref:protein phosphatase 1 regulatory subunit 37-like n=1 Tax=Sinocyclocheilus rhinocerous TaxID=307959 RepID=UPI0007B95E1E|nr:PREDICTED: protein phosphatase 1 regulatory subunit 37-like [Sinocyclocheilus rhinocerous]